ncbi:MAG: DUF4079 domain-containing protein [Leptolyngbyaceae cyanobacterium SM1_1_3]|nr:DUF4079 domain-containing protein [Leptolyngbyaceae cyanobacterium SM1_1_3]NJN02753.1 DUF4079 domain-containing protein [Leptolyngbyaceae cyanobacterium RM1_1_2]NJO09302.1 DUF4079 domain-containing protein [Leptolyngbyaceae cyanobacterium SL_1_1]
MEFADWLRLMHPILAVVVVFPSIGMVTYFAWQTRQRRLKTKAKEKTKIPPTVGSEHVNLGRWLTGAVTGLAILGVGHPIFKHIVTNQVWAEAPFRVAFIVAMFVLTLATLVFLYRARSKTWRIVFAALTIAGLWILGSQDGVFRRTSEWYISHYYYGMAAATLMIVSLAILPEIYKSLSWRRTHIILNCIALVFFMVQGITGTRDLLEIPLSWQEPYIYSCDFAAKSCPE